MFLPKLPDGYSYGLLFSYAKGKQLDVYGKMLTLLRKKFELDVFYKRMLAKKALEMKLKEESD